MKSKRMFSRATLLCLLTISCLFACEEFEKITPSTVDNAIENQPLLRNSLSSSLSKPPDTIPQDIIIWDGTLAFPGAVGFGAKTKGAYAGSSSPRILIVDQLNGTSGNETTGRGSFLWAISRNYPRIVLFEVSGYVDLPSRTDINNSYISIYGQTAPSPGITIRYYPIRIAANQVLIQHLRFRFSDLMGTVSDAFDIYKGSNMIIDHCSFSWGIDETFSIHQPGYNSRAITISDCIISEGLSSPIDPTPHSYGMVACNTDSLTLIRNLWSHLGDRSPNTGEYANHVEIINNLLYNTGATNCNIYVNNTAIASKFNIIGNVLLPGLSTRNSYIIRIKEGNFAGTQAYCEDNEGPHRTSDPWSVVSCTTKVAFRSDVPLFTDLSITPMSSLDVKDYVLLNVGARPWDRDAVDERIINDVKSRTGRMINSQKDVGGFPTLASNIRILTLPSDPHDDSNGNGYANLEEWICTFER